MVGRTYYSKTVDVPESKRKSLSRGYSQAFRMWTSDKDYTLRYKGSSTSKTEVDDYFIADIDIAMEIAQSRVN